MSCFPRIVNRGDKYNGDDNIKNKWRWEWTEKKVKVGEGEQRVSDCFRKVFTPGLARCILCSKDVLYSNRGVAALMEHMSSAKHLEATKAVGNQSRLPGQPIERDEHYGMDPAVRAAAVKKPLVDSEPLTPLADRVSNLEALTLAFAAENNMSMRDVPKLVEYAKAMANDKAALGPVKLGDKDTASYKLQYGLGAALEDELLQELQTTPFSLNIEATSKTNKRVLAVLVSHFSASEGKIVVHHLTAFSLTRVTAQAIFEKLEEMFDTLDLPWNNLVSVLLDSCAVMRGSKKGLESLIREHANHLLDIDGDSIHHCHNAAKAFCKPFGRVVENVMNDVYNDFKWSTDMKTFLSDICLVLGVKPTVPERYVPHRWLSVMDVALDTLRLFDAYTLFYYSFLSAKDMTVYLDVMQEVLERNGVSKKGQEEIVKMQRSLRKRYSSFTKEGKDRKHRILEKVFFQRTKTQLMLNLYIHVLPDLKKYVMFFQRREPSMHLLHSKQHELFIDFCSNFMDPEALVGDPKKINLADRKKQLSDQLLFIGTDNVDLLESSSSAINKKEFMEKVREAYVACGESLQKKMPLQSKALKMCAALDPEVRKTKTCLSYLKKIPPHFYPDRSGFEKEIRKYNVDHQISKDLSVPVDQYWNSINSQTYPNLTAAAKALLSGFHGPLVESSFSGMGDLMNEKTGHMIDGTYKALQTVRYYLKTKGKTAVEQFSKQDPVRDPVDKKLCQLMQNAYKGRQERQTKNREEAQLEQERLGAPRNKPATKKADRADLLAQVTQAKAVHRQTVSVRVDAHATISARKRPALPPLPSPNAKRPCNPQAETPNMASTSGEVDSSPTAEDNPKKPLKTKQASIFSFFK